MVLILNESWGGDRIAAAKSIRSMSELRGRRVAVTYSTLGPYVLSWAQMVDYATPPSGWIHSNAWRAHSHRMACPGE